MNRERGNNKNTNQGFPGGIGRISGRGGFGSHRGMAPVIKPKNFKGTLKRLWGYFGREKKLLFIIFTFIIIDALILLFAPYLIGKAVESMSSFSEGVDFNLLGIIVLTLLTAYVANAVLNFFQGWLMAGVAQRIVKSFRSTLFEKLQKLPVAFFDVHSHGEVMSRLSNDIENISGTVSQSTTQLMSGAITVIGSLTMMLTLSPLLTSVTLVTVPLVFALAKTIARKTRVLFKEQQAELGTLNGQIEEAISGIQIIKAFNHEEKSIQEFQEINTRLCEVGTKAQIWSGFLMPIMNVINNLGFALVASLGGILAVKGLISVGVIASFLMYSRQFTRPLNDIAGIFNNLQSAVAGAERVFEILDEKEEPLDPPEASELTNAEGEVTFQNVTFGYKEEVPILKNISFHAKAGSNIALVGPTGAGKTTIVNLITRFYDVNKGSILIDGRDIKDYSRNSLRNTFGIVLQDTYLFSGTIEENIRYGRPEADFEEIKEAARMAKADTFINRLPKGYKTMLQESGANLSQGQRQLLAIARAILSKPSILILDEATSSVDTRTELNIQQAMLNIMKDRTSFIIAHRLSTIRDADIIMVIDNGQIMEQGNHEELLKKKGVYYDMYYRQCSMGEL